MSIKNVPEEVSQHYPVQVSQVMDKQSDLDTWKEFLENKGFITHIHVFNTIKNGRTEKRYVLYRSLSQEEAEGITSRKYILVDHFITHNLTRSSAKRLHIEGVCPRCGKTHSDSKVGKHSFCRVCQEIAKGDCSGGGGISTVQQKKEEVCQS